MANISKDVEQILGRACASDFAARSIVERANGGDSASFTVGWFGTAPVGQQTALTTELTTLTLAATASDFAIQAITATGPFGFENKAEADSVLWTIQRNSLRIKEMETALTNFGLIGS